jgi:pimeloyl-ACP methyl ester carboxylesterase
MLQLEIVDRTWNWQGFPIKYRQCGDRGAAIVLVHGFGASSGHWRKNLPVLGEFYRCYAIDLIGFGASAKPSPEGEISYTFETWSRLIADFCREIVGSPVFLIGNSIGCVAIMQTAVEYPDLVLGIAALNCSLRLLSDRKIPTLPWYRRWGTSVLQNILSNKTIGYFFFQQLAKPNTVKKILLQAYHRPEAVTDELIDILLQPTADKGAADVFLAFIRYSQGAIPEDLLPLLSCPIVLLWGTKDPWEDIKLGRKLGEFPTVEKFIPLEGLGHCPQDEAPEIVNPILIEWVREKIELRQ